MNSTANSKAWCTPKIHSMPPAIPTIEMPSIAWSIDASSSFTNHSQQGSRLNPSTGVAPAYSAFSLRQKLAAGSRPFVLSRPGNWSQKLTKAQV